MAYFLWRNFMNAKISFYLIEKNPSSTLSIAVRLCKQIYLKHRIWLYCATDEQCQQFEQQLWQDKNPTAFFAHGIDQHHAPICISTQLPTADFDVCINYTATPFPLADAKHASLHLIEIIANDENSKIQGRERFKFYRQHSIEPQVYRL